MTIRDLGDSAAINADFADLEQRVIQAGKNAELWRRLHDIQWLREHVMFPDPPEHSNDEYAALVTELLDGLE